MKIDRDNLYYARKYYTLPDAREKAREVATRVGCWIYLVREKDEIFGGEDEWKIGLTKEISEEEANELGIGEEPEEEERLSEWYMEEDENEGLPEYAGYVKDDEDIQQYVEEVEAREEAMREERREDIEMLEEKHYEAMEDMQPEGIRCGKRYDLE